MVLDNLIANRQPEACTNPDALGRKARVEHFLKILFGDAATCVFYGDVNFVVLDEGGYGYLSFAFYRLFGIDEEIEENLIQSPWKAGNGGEVTVVFYHRDVVLYLMVD